MTIKPLQMCVKPRVFVSHPGTYLLAELVERRRITVSGLAEVLDLSRQQTSAILNGHSRLLSWQAKRIQKSFDISADLLLEMQSDFDVAKIRNRLRIKRA